MGKKHQQKSTKRKVGKVLLILLAVAAVVLLGARLFLRVPVRDTYAASDRAFIIPGLREGFVPQGLDYDAEENAFFITGYQRKQGASPVYVVDRTSGSQRSKASLLALDGSEFTGHAGGLSVWGEYVYVAGSRDACVYVYRKADILAAGDGQTVSCLGKVDTFFGENDGVTVAWTSVHDGLLTVGEFYKEPQYPTPESHKFTTPAGDACQALALTYQLDERAPFGVNPQPVSAYALPDLAQGMTFADGRVWISASWGLSFSTVTAYELDRLSELGTLPSGEGTIPLYALDSASLAASYRLPPMSEEIIFVDGKLYTMCESASRQYYFGALTGAWWCYATDLTKMK